MNIHAEPVVALDRAAARAAISAAAERFAAVLRETDDIRCPAAGTDWTVAETAAHVSVVLAGFSAAVAGEMLALTPEQYLDADFPTRLAAVNRATIAMVDRVDACRLAQSITDNAHRLLELLEAADPQLKCQTPWYGPGRTRNPDCLTALALGELTVHGYDMATGMGRPWPISAEHARLIVGTVCPEMSPLVVRPEAARRAPLTYEIRLRGGPRYAIRVADGTAEVRAAGGRVDCVISADPVTYLLVVYGRMPLRVALLRGGISAAGRRPWLALRFQSLFFNP
ncbi:maleylpyruvate isomerase N-terminal domain-containing protein [Mycolicibacterium arseniciresistens]|uniref:Maleylpyruvate isomerase N-terminal domain-containing protein n=1 Tax=Mycolicibacterium arseniciresistens TaxID=3062257 RepID=A0ABT8UJG0_9MYCO|nr:maleylpyruvate isomerase N-terminal domain-containing protein [Mycolicibacterium arseniciresistens]MDO3636960.1 maleylpyruvate isomerase N-terminal domain-containing protein [Mycolicibacterium arseniciresistens]